MGRGVNEVRLLGNIGDDVNLIQSSDDKRPMLRLSIATNESWQDKTTGESVNHTEWHKVVYFGKPAEALSKYAKKGSEVFVMGRNRTNKYQDKESGEDKYSHQVVASNIILTGSAPASSKPATSGEETAA